MHSKKQELERLLRIAIEEYKATKDKNRLSEEIAVALVHSEIIDKDLALRLLKLQKSTANF
jgi:hypothetical protein